MEKEVAKNILNHYFETVIILSLDLANVLTKTISPQFTMNSQKPFIALTNNSHLIF